MKRFFLSLLLFGIICWGQDGTPDLSFGDDGLLIIPLGNNPPLDQALLWGVAENSSGNILAYAEYNFGAEFHYIISIAENGSLDSSWGTDGFLELQGIDYPDDHGIMVQSDDKILIKNKNAGLNGLYRFLPNGTIDLNFGTDGYLQLITTSNEFNIILVNDQIFYQSIAIVGDIYTCVIEKYTADGELDSSFADNGILEIPFAGTNDYSVIDVEIISNGSFLIFYKEDDGSTSSYRVMKLDSGGLVDLSYGNNGMSEIIPVGPSFGGRTLVSYPDGSCFLNFSYWDSTNDEFIHTLFKLTASGFIDTVFGNQGEKEGSDAKIVQENGRVIADNPTYDWEGGYYMDYHRFYQDGFVDPSFTFDPPISGALGLTYSFILESGKLLIGSSSIWYNPEAHLIFQRLNNNPLGVEEFSNTSMVVSPNPSEGIFTVFLENYNQSMEYSISDISGKLIHTGTILSPTYSFDLSLVEDGMYFLSLPGKTFKLLKQ